MELRKAVDNLYLYDPQFEPAASKFVGEVGGSTATQAVTRWDDVKAAMAGHVLVKFLVFDTHGRPGAVCLRDGTQIEGIDLMVVSAYPQFLRSEVRVLFLGCNIGEGSLGDQFIGDVGKYFLRGKGGIVGATTVPNIVLQLGPFASESYMQPFSSGRLKVKRYDRTGAPIGSREVDRYGAAR